MADESARQYLEQARQTKNPVSFQSIAAKIPAPRTSSSFNTSSPGFLARLLQGVNQAFINRQPLVLGLGSAFCLIIALTVFQVYRHQGQAQGSQYASKGSGHILLNHRQVSYKPGSSLNTAAGDTLTFSTRYAKALYLQIWYRDDNGSLFAYLEASGSAHKVAASTVWYPLSYKIILDSNWSSEQIFVVTGTKVFKSAQAIQAINANGDSSSNTTSLSVHTYNITRVQ